MSLSLEVTAPEPGLTPWFKTAWRYGISTAGPIATSGAHFLASLLFVRNLTADNFGLFSFILVIVPFAMSATAALLIIPVTNSLGEPAQKRALVNACCLKLNVVLSALTALGVSGALLAAHAALAPAILLGLFGGAFTFRWFGRCFAYVEGRMMAAVGSDVLYALALMAGLAALWFSRTVTLTNGAAIMLMSALLAWLPLGKAFFADQIRALWTGKLGLYRATFRDLTRWSLLGVALTEITVNAHAYFVTFISGSGTFALLAVGMLLLRPASLVQSALPDLERPVMVRQMAARDRQGLRRTNQDFGIALIAVLLLTLVLDAVLLIWFPGLVLKEGYGLHDVVVVTALSALIMAVRALRAPPAVHLQAAGWFKEMAAIGAVSSVVSIVAVLVLLLTLGPIASLGGVLLGELVILMRCRALVRDWQAQNV